MAVVRTFRKGHPYFWIQQRTQADLLVSAVKIDVQPMGAVPSKS